MGESPKPATPVADGPADPPPAAPAAPPMGLGEGSAQPPAQLPAQPPAQPSAQLPAVPKAATPEAHPDWVGSVGVIQHPTMGDIHVHAQNGNLHFTGSNGTAAHSPVPLGDKSVQPLETPSAVGSSHKLEIPNNLKHPELSSHVELSPGFNVSHDQEGGKHHETEVEIPGKGSPEHIEQIGAALKAGKRAVVPDAGDEDHPVNQFVTGEMEKDTPHRIAEQVEHHSESGGLVFHPRGKVASPKQKEEDDYWAGVAKESAPTPKDKPAPEEPDIEARGQAPQGGKDYRPMENDQFYEIDPKKGIVRDADQQGTGRGIPPHVVNALNKEHGLNLKANDRFTSQLDNGNIVTWGHHVPDAHAGEEGTDHLGHFTAEYFRNRQEESGNRENPKPLGC